MDILTVKWKPYVKYTQIFTEVLTDRASFLRDMLSLSYSLINPYASAVAVVSISRR